MLRFKTAFTIIELIIVITVIAIVSTAIIGGYNRISSGFKANLAVDNLLSELRLLQNDAAKQSELCYGISTNANSDLILVKAGYLDRFNLCDTQNLETISNYTESEGVSLDSVKQEATRISNDRFLIMFYPPEGKAYFPDPAISAQTALEFGLSAPELAEPSFIQVSPTGLISNASQDEV